MLDGGAAPLHEEVLAMLAAQAGGKARREMTVAETRQAMLAGRLWQAEPPADVASRDETANGVPVRLYGLESEQALLYLHGGRFFSGGLETHDWPLRLLASLAGRRICAVDYRLAPEHRHPAAVEDALAAGRWLAGECDRMVIGGDSAGGYLAALAALELSPAAQMLIYPMLDPECGSDSCRKYWRGPWPSGEDMRRGWELYGGEAVTAELGRFPRTLLVTAGVDPLRDEGLAFGAGLRARGVEVEAHHFADMPHGFFTQTRLVRARELMRVLANSLGR
jgi:acetyl esterase